MLTQYLRLGATLVSIVGISLLGVSNMVQADGSPESVLYSLPSSKLTPVGPLVQGRDGNFYGALATDSRNSTPSKIIQVTPAGIETDIFVFDTSEAPSGGLTLGPDGNFYGVTASNEDAPAIFYRVTPTGVFTKVLTFPDAGVSGKLIVGSDGNFYGVSSGGGANNDGLIFTISQAGAYSVLYTFNGTDGAFPENPLVQTADGTFYGVTSQVFNNNNSSLTAYGSLFKFSSSGLTSLYQFNPSQGAMAGPSNGYSPTDGLVLGSDGNFYGVTAIGGGFEGGASSKVYYGTFYQATSNGSVKFLHSFGTATNDGLTPTGTPLQGNDGNYYGATSAGGVNNEGALYSITPDGVESVLHSFGVDAGDGNAPTGGLILASDGNFYGVASGGGATGSGAYYKTSGGVATASQPVVSISANPAAITVGQSTVLTWSTTNATNCTATGAWTGTQSTAGSATETPTAPGSSTYTLTCTGPGGSANSTASVSVATSPSSPAPGNTPTPVQPATSTEDSGGAFGLGSLLIIGLGVIGRRRMRA